MNHGALVQEIDSIKVLMDREVAKDWRKKGISDTSGSTVFISSIFPSKLLNKNLRVKGFLSLAQFPQNFLGMKFP